MSRFIQTPPLKVKLLHPKAKLPEYNSEGAAGLDLTCVDSHYFLKGERYLLSTGIAVEIPWGYEGQIRPRSGFASMYGLTVLNAPGTIDSDYRGEIRVLLINLGQVAKLIKAGTKIAQLVISPVAKAVVEEVTSLSVTERGDAGFGSTGLDNTSDSTSGSANAGTSHKEDFCETERISEENCKKFHIPCEAEQPSGEKHKGLQLEDIPVICEVCNWKGNLARCCWTIGDSDDKCRYYCPKCDRLQVTAQSRPTCSSDSEVATPIPSWCSNCNRSVRVSQYVCKFNSSLDVLHHCPYCNHEVFILALDGINVIRKGHFVNPYVNVPHLCS